MNQSRELILYYAPGACSLVSLIALEEVGVPFEARLVSLVAAEQRRPDYVAMNPSGKVPLLLVDGEPLPQNAAILTFLACEYPQSSLLPFTGDNLEDAMLLAKLVRFSADVHPFVTRIRMPHLINDADPVRGRAQACEMFPFQLDHYEKVLGQSPWILGDAFSALDAYLFWVWGLVTGAGFDPEPFPAIAAHYARVEARPSVQRAQARVRTGFAELEERGLTLQLK